MLAAPEDEDTDRALAVLFARVVPVAGLVGALIVGGIAGLAPALLVVAGAALLGTIGFFWASLRTLSGDAPLPVGVSSRVVGKRTPAPERKRELLRALKDLELEHSIGKIDDVDYLELSGRYRDAAKTLMREMDDGIAPRRKQAEALVLGHLEKRKIRPAGREIVEQEDDEEEQKEPEASNRGVTRLECAKCAVSNEPDAAFCKKCGGSLMKPPSREAPDASA
jgi:ribosomal protein L40E